LCWNVAVCNLEQTSCEQPCGPYSPELGPYFISFTVTQNGARIRLARSPVHRFKKHQNAEAAGHLPRTLQLIEALRAAVVGDDKPKDAV
jgi:hypothetical protein